MLPRTGTILFPYFARKQEADKCKQLPKVYTHWVAPGFELSSNSKAHVSNLFLFSLSPLSKCTPFTWVLQSPATPTNVLSPPLTVIFPALTRHGL